MWQITNKLQKGMYQCLRSSFTFRCSFLNFCFFIQIAEKDSIRLSDFRNALREKVSAAFSSV